VPNWLFAQTAHVIWSKYCLAWWVVFKFHQHGGAVTELWGVEILLILLLRPMAYTTALLAYGRDW